MKQVTLVLLLCTGLLLMTSTTWANVDKERELQARLSDTDASPNIGPVNYPQVDDQWDLLFSSEIGLLVGDNQLLGGEFAGGNFYATGGNSAGEPNQVYIIDPTGTTFTQFDQWSSAGWGWRDLAYDGTYLYGSDDYVIDAFDLTGAAVTTMNIPGPITPCRALAYDPVTDHFWTASFSSALYEIDRSGAVIWSGSTGLTGVYGAAWDYAATDAPWLWLFDQSGTPSTTFHQFDPVAHIMTGVSYTVPLLPGSTDQMAGGAFFTSDFDPSYHTLGGVTQGTPEDQVFILEMYDAANPLAPAAPTNFTLTPDAGGALSCDLAWDLPTTTVNGSPISSYPITSVIVQRDGSTIATLGPTATSHTDAPPAADEYTYKVYCINSYGDGIGTQDMAWVGEDVPGPCTDFTVTPVGEELEADLSWVNPTVGMHGGYFMTSSITGYTIERYGPDPATIELTGGVQVSYNDGAISVQGWYQYEITAHNASGSGEGTMSIEVYIGPPPFEEIPYDWVEINPAYPGALPGTSSGITLDDQNVGPFPMGFTFPWYEGASYNSIRICSNGFLTFTSTYTSFTNYQIPYTNEPNNLVAPYWDDMNISSTYYGSIWYYADPGGDFFIVEFDSCNHYGSTITDEYFTFEAIFYPSGDMDFQYKAIVPGNMSPFPSATVGIENGTGTVGVQVTYDGSGPWEPTSESAIRVYSPSVSVTYDVEIQLTYVSGSPVPSGGGGVDFDVLVTNNESMSVTFDAWLDITLPNTQVVTLINRELTMVGTSSIPRSLTITVPDYAPSGPYTATGKVGDYPSNAWDESSFPFEKSGDGDGVYHEGMFTLSGWLEQADMMLISQAPQEFTMHGAYPNPFNPATTLSFTIPEASKVQLNVYDISGRLVAELVNGWRDVGTHEAVFDGSKLASGVYFYSLTAGDHNAVGKMIMLK